MTIYTIGHSNYPEEKLIHMLRHYNIDTVVDIIKKLLKKL
jgi:hypothetical protein